MHGQLGDLRFHPLAMFANQIHQSIDRFGFGTVELDRLLAHIKIDFAGRSAHVAKIRICHLTGSIHNATHDRNLDSLQVGGAGFDSGRNSLKVK